MNRGFTLVELLIAMMVLAVGIVGVMGGMSGAKRAITKAGYASTITHLGYQKMEQLKATARSNWSHADLTVGSHPATAAARMVGSLFPGYSVTWTVADAPETGMKTIVIEVGFRLYNDSGVSINHPDVMRQKFQTFLSQ